MSVSSEQKRRKIWQQTRLNLSIVGDLSHSDNIFSVFNEKSEKFALLMWPACTIQYEYKAARCHCGTDAVMARHAARHFPSFAFSLRVLRPPNFLVTTMGCLRTCPSPSELLTFVVTRVHPSGTLLAITTSPFCLKKCNQCIEVMVYTAPLWVIGLRLVSCRVTRHRVSQSQYNAICVPATPEPAQRHDNTTGMDRECVGQYMLSRILSRTRIITIIINQKRKFSFLTSWQKDQKQSQGP
jgi:hypothetical protein